MSFTEQNMSVFSARCKAFMASLQNLRQEAAKLEAIYGNEASSGGAPAWDDVNGITADEHVDCILLFRDFDKFLTNQAVDTIDRQVWITPFIQDA